MWRSKKSKADETVVKAGDDEGAEVGKVEEPKTRTSSTSTLMAKLWNKNKGSKSNTSEEDLDPTKGTEQAEEQATVAAKDEEDTTTTGEENPKTEDGALAPKSRWTSLWGRSSQTNNPDKEKEEGSTSNDIEVEISTDSRKLNIHDPTRERIQSLPLSFGPSSDRPSVHDEALEMLTGALLIYIFADLREMAREGVIEQADLLQDPIAIHQVVTAIQNNQEALAARAIQHEVIGEKIKALKAIHQQQQQDDAQDDPGAPTRIEQVLQGGAVASAAGLMQSKESVLAQFHDEKTTQGVVYGIAVNHLRKRITVVFRGSVTQQDFITDAKSSQKKVDNPVAALDPESHAHIKIHTGFYQYLFRKDDEGKVRLQHILDDVKKLLIENPGYRLYCTGHSLGGACCTLCGFYAAMDDEIVKHGPVVIYSVASPRVGGYEFCDAFHRLEQLGRLQHLRVSNKEDVVTHLPFITLKATAMSPLLSAIRGAGNIYKHCGINLELKTMEEQAEEREDGETSKHYQLCHPNGKCLNSERSSSFYSKEFQGAFEAAKNLAESLAPVRNADFETLTEYHSCREYETRLMAAEEYFSTVTLDQLYRDASIVGKTLAEGSS